MGLIILVYMIGVTYYIETTYDVVRSWSSLHDTYITSWLVGRICNYAIFLVMSIELKIYHGNILIFHKYSRKHKHLLLLIFIIDFYLILTMLQRHKIQRISLFEIWYT